jgi:hypothetical protein
LNALKNYFLQKLYSETQGMDVELIEPLEMTDYRHLERLFENRCKTYNQMLEMHSKQLNELKTKLVNIFSLFKSINQGPLANFFIN